MLTQAHIDQFNATRKTEGLEVAELAFLDVIKGFDITGAEHLALRREIWNKVKADLKSETQAADEKKAATNAKRQATRQRNANKEDISALCEAVLCSNVASTNSLTNFSEREKKFLNDIKTKRTLTEKQESWLRSLAERGGITIKGNISARSTRAKKICEHGDLGSRGYKLGDYVRCPDCGEMTNVW